VTAARIYTSTASLRRLIPIELETPIATARKDLLLSSFLPQPFPRITRSSGQQAYKQQQQSILSINLQIKTTPLSRIKSTHASPNSENLALEIY
jgi:hypothetical protein